MEVQGKSLKKKKKGATPPPQPQEGPKRRFRVVREFWIHEQVFQKGKLLSHEDVAEHLETLLNLGLVEEVT